MNLLSEAHIRRHYAQGVGSVVRLANRVEELEARPVSEPQPVIAALSKELAKLKAALPRQSRELRELHQINHRLLRRIRELKHEVERDPALVRDSHNSSLPPSSNPPWQKVPRTRSLRKQSGRRVNGQPDHPSVTLRQSAHPDRIVTHTTGDGRGAAGGCIGTLTLFS